MYSLCPLSIEIQPDMVIDAPRIVPYANGHWDQGSITVAPNSRRNSWQYNDDDDLDFEALSDEDIEYEPLRPTRKPGKPGKPAKAQLSDKRPPNNQYRHPD